jgi:nitric oxide dioxygenase
MTPEQIALVRESFSRAAPQADALARAFYARLFEVDPGLRPMFRTDPAEQRRKLGAALGCVVDSLDRPEELLERARTLGLRHVTYGVLDRDYDTVGAALLATLQEASGDGWTPELAEAWTAAYAELAGAMRAAGRTALLDAA